MPSIRECSPAVRYTGGYPARGLQRYVRYAIPAKFTITRWVLSSFANTPPCSRFIRHQEIVVMDAEGNPPTSRSRETPNSRSCMHSGTLSDYPARFPGISRYSSHGVSTGKQRTSYNTWRLGHRRYSSPKRNPAAWYPSTRPARYDVIWTSGDT